MLGHSNIVSHLTFSPDGGRLLSASWDGTSKIWDVTTGSLIATLIVQGDEDWLILTPEGFFDASENGAKLLSVVRGLEVYSIDQFYDKLHRPELVRQKLAGDPLGKVREAAAQLDLTKAVASGSVPTVNITSPALSATVSANEITVEAYITDRGGGIGKVEWRRNKRLIALVNWERSERAGLTGP